jgi:hypothetical protein
VIQFNWPATLDADLAALYGVTTQAILHGTQNDASG